MSFSVNYLGANITQVGLNFSRPAAQILGQYYQFIRLGFQGYKAVQYNSMQITQYLHDEIGKMAPFVNYSDHVENPLFIWYMKPDYAKTAKWTLYDLQDKLKQGGWMVPAYTLPENIQNYVVMRIVVRQGFSRDMADMLLNDIRDAVASLEKLEYPTNTRIAQDKNIEVKGSVFTHTGNRHKTKNRNMKKLFRFSKSNKRSTKRTISIKITKTVRMPTIFPILPTSTKTCSVSAYVYWTDKLSKSEILNINSV